MRLIQAKVSEEQFKAFSHYLVDGDLTVAEAIVGWIEEHCGVDVGASKTPKVKSKPVETDKVVVEVPKPYGAMPHALNRPVMEKVVVSEPVGGASGVLPGVNVMKERFDGPALGQKPVIVYPDETNSARHKCAICHLSFPESEMTYHAKTLKWACNDCVEKQG